MSGLRRTTVCSSRVMPAFGEADRRWGEHSEARRIAAHDRAALQKVENPETGGETRTAGRRQDVVRPRYVVTDRLGRMTAEKNCSGMMHPLRKRVSLVERE